MTVLTIMTVIREEKRRASKHKREREGRHSRGWNLIRDKYNIKRRRRRRIVRLKVRLKRGRRRVWRGGS